MYLQALATYLVVEFSCDRVWVVIVSAGVGWAQGKPTYA